MNYTCHQDVEFDFDAEIQHQENLSDLADKFLDAELAQGAPFTEGLCNWAMNKAMQALGT